MRSLRRDARLKASILLRLCIEKYGQTQLAWRMAHFERRVKRAAAEADAKESHELFKGDA